MRKFDRPGRSAVHASEAMVATSHPLASSTAIEILKAGGNAIDAAVAASATLCIVEPQSTGIGGDCFAIVTEPDGSIHGLNGSGRAPAGAHLDYYLDNKINVLWDHPEHTVTAPGAINAWEMLLEKFGTMGFDQLFQNAIHYGENGFPISPRVSRDWGGLEELLLANEAAVKHFLVDGHAPKLGSIHKLPAMAQTLRTIAQKGAGAFYSGEIAAEMATNVQALGGFLSEEDIAAVQGDWVTPISVNYKGYEIHEIPPNGQGITALVLLKLLNRLGSDALDADSPERVHLEMEAGRIAYGIRDAYVSDPATMGRTVEQILANDHIEQLAGLYSADKRNDDLTLPELPRADTIYLTVVDRDQRAVSFINSVYAGFGSGIVTPKGGFAMQNRGACFVVEEGHDNAIGPSKRPMHTIIPGMVTKDGKAQYSFGVMGGAYQPMGHGHVIANMIDYGMDPQEALDHPRVFWDADEVIETEAGCPAGLNDFLAGKGHNVRQATSPHGGGQIIRIDHANGTLVGGSDPRKDGQAQGY